MTTELDLTDTIDIRDVIERFEELESEREDLESVIADAETDAEVNDAQTALTEWDDENFAEFEALESLLSDLEGEGGDEKWRGNWYPQTLIRESYFVDYCKELLVDAGDIPADLPDYVEIDWDATAENVRVDYSTVEIDGVEYFYR